MTPEEITAHEEAMVARAEEAETLAEAKADPEKVVASSEESAKEQEVSTEEAKKQAEAPKEEPKGLEIEDKEPPKEEETSKVITQEDLSRYTEEFLANGELSEDTYKELAEQGFDKSVVDAYVQGQQALRDREVNSVYEAVGGKDTYSEMIAFAKENYTPEQIEGFNAAVGSGNQSQIMFAVNALKSQYEAAKGSPIQGRKLTGNTTASGSGGVKGYATKSEMMKAMSDPRYYTDPSYNKMVAEKVALTTF